MSGGMIAVAQMFAYCPNRVSACMRGGTVRR
jgi:hypothetical protein